MKGQVCARVANYYWVQITKLSREKNRINSNLWRSQCGVIRYLRDFKQMKRSVAVTVQPFPHHFNVCRKQQYSSKSLINTSVSSVFDAEEYAYFSQQKMLLFFVLVMCLRTRRITLYTTCNYIILTDISWQYRHVSFLAPWTGDNIFSGNYWWRDDSVNSVAISHNEVLSTYCAFFMSEISTSAIKCYIIHIPYSIIRMIFHWSSDLLIFWSPTATYIVIVGAKNRGF